MGIDDLKKYLRDKHSQVIKRINISEFSGNKITVDLSTYIYKYKVVYGDAWLNPMINLICTFKKFFIHAQFIKDGKAPPEKDPERERRKDVKDNLDSTVFNLSLDLQNYKEKGIVTDLLIKTMEKIQKSNEKANKVSRLFKLKKTGKNPIEDKLNMEHIDVDAVEEYIAKKEKQIVNISPQDIEKLLSIFKAFGVPVIQAPGEAEALGSYKCRYGDCVAILTEDTDVLTYNVPIFLSDLDTATGDCEAIYVEDVLEALDMTHDQFIDFCIMCGCDYNPRIPRNGPAAAFKFIKKFGSIEKFIEEEGRKASQEEDYKPLNYKILNHIRSRELFKTYGNLVPINKIKSEKILKKYKSLYWETLISFEDLFSFLNRSRCRYSQDNIEELWKEADVVFSEELEIPSEKVDQINDKIINEIKQDVDEVEAENIANIEKNVRNNDEEEVLEFASDAEND